MYVYVYVSLSTLNLDYYYLLRAPPMAQLDPTLTVAFAARGAQSCLILKELSIP